MARTEMETFSWYCEQLPPAADLLEISPDVGPDRHSFLAILRKGGA